MSSATQTTAPRSPVAGQLRSLVLSKEGVLLIILLIAIVVLSIGSDKFLTKENILNQGRLMTEVGLMALPMTFIIITGGIDLSVGSTFGFSAIMLGYLWQTEGWPLGAAVAASLVVGVLCGLLNGLFIVYVKVPPIIMTLATAALYRGMAYGVSQARAASGFPESFFRIGQGDLLGLPFQVWFLIVAIILTAVLLARTPLGRGIYAIGNNEVGARFAGIPVNSYKLFIYTLAGFMAALAGWIYTSRVSSTRADAGAGWELDAIAAVVLGGTAITGGSGSIPGTVIGLVLIQLLKNGLSLAGAKGEATIVVIGVILILSILLNNYIQKRFGTT